MRILLIDDHTMFRTGLVLQLQQLKPEAQVIPRDSPQAARALFDEPGALFDVIVLDLGMPGFQRLEALSYFRGLCPEIPCVVVSGNEDPQLVRDCVEMGAFGFIPKSADAAQLTQALDCLTSGDVWLPGSAVSAGAGGPDKPAPTVWSQARVHITERQRDVLRGLVQGRTNKMIARDLGISDGTVKTHVTHLMELLQVNTRTQIVFELARQGIRIQDMVAPPPAAPLKG
jgi:DNA-binding NarL/FixJ family response regulator